MNLFKLPESLPNEEIFETLIPDQGILIERIVSSGQRSPEDFWYNQVRDEWVVLLQGQAMISWKDGRTKTLSAGDWVFIPSGEAHRVDFTSAHPPCIWLAVHGQMK